MPDNEDVLAEQFEQERADLATKIHKAMTSSYIGGPRPRLLGDAERAAAAVILAGWVPGPSAAQRPERTAPVAMMDDLEQMIVFLTARVAEDHQHAHALTRGGFQIEGDLTGGVEEAENAAFYFANAARQLDSAHATQELITRCTEAIRLGHDDFDIASETLRLLAAHYRSHPDFEDWWGR